MQQTILKNWQKRGLFAWTLSPLACLVCTLSFLKRKAYARGWLKQAEVNVPVIVVGNISAGGTGKTPLLIYIVSLLKKTGYQPGIISRGYKGKAAHWPQAAKQDSDPALLGDEPVMLARKTACPIMVGPDRFESAQRLLDEFACDVIISDDGFQHLKLARDIDIVVLAQQGKRLFGNGWCMPSGPLREGVSALKEADMLVLNSLESTPRFLQDAYKMRLVQGSIYLLNQAEAVVDVDVLKSQKLHAVAGIGKPEIFFKALKSMGLNIIEHAFNDHQVYDKAMLNFDDEYAIITTEKDAVKFEAIYPSALSGGAVNKAVYVLPVSAKMDVRFDETLLKKLKKHVKE